MLRRLLLALVLATAFSVPARANLLDSWHEVQADLAAGDVAGARTALSTLQEEAAELEVRRMPGFAAALVTWAEAHPGADGDAVLRIARELDPELPASYFLAARWSAEKGATVAALGEMVSGWFALFKYEPTRSVVGGWLMMWAVFAIVAAIITFILVLTVRYLRGMVFDARALGGKVFQPANAWVLAVVLILLPLFAALGPMWLVVYLFAMSWAYFRPALRIWSLVAYLLLAMAVPTLAWVEHEILHTADLATRLGTVLDERQADFSTLGEFSNLAEEFEDDADYHRILGELLRMHGEPSLAKVEFQKATLLDPNDPQPLIFVANLALEEGNTKRAIQHFSQALEIDSQNAFAYHNLSLAFDLSRRFQEGDQARARARAIAGRGVAEEGLRGLDPRVRYPRLGSEDVEHFVEGLSPDQVARLKSAPPSLDPVKRFASPISLIFVVGALVGLVLLFSRLKWFPAARECGKCGKVYRLESGFGESAVYCSQCVSVFMKRDVVSIEQQTAKMNQIRRWESWTSFLRRITGFLIPGSSGLLGGRVVRGSLTGFLAAFFLTGALVWIPLFVPRIEPLAGIRPLQILLLVLFVLTAMRSGIAAWNRR